jgi:prepilin-type N-terminal cleavage/methylation domain-containing protein
MKKKRGFTLIEVIVALAIFMVVTVALLSSYYSYYSYVKDLRYKSIGQNLAQLQLEDIEGLSISVIDSLVKGGQFPVLTYDEPNYPPKPANPPPPSNQFFIDYGTTYENVYDSIRYDSNTGKYYLMDGSFRIEHIMNILGVESATGTISNPPPVPALPSDLLLPSNIEIKPVLRTDQTTGETYYDFTIILHKEVFPHYQKRIIIIDKTPTMTNLLNKIYEIRVIVYWTLKDGTMKSITVTGEKSATRQQD